MYPVSCTTFIKDSFTGGFPVFESMSTFLAVPIEEFVVLDCGSTDGTREILDEIETHNSRVRIIDTMWPTIERGGQQIVDAQSFAIIMNQAIDACKNDRVMAYQADCCWTPKLLDMTKGCWDQGLYDLSYWRVQLKHNWQTMKWFPHLIHSCIVKGQSLFVKDGMNTNRVFDAHLVSTWTGTWFSQWGAVKGRRWL